MNDIETKSLYIRCSCNSNEHLAVFDYIKDNVDKDMYLSIHLNSLPLHKRILYAIKYIIGCKNTSGAFSEIVLNDKSVKEIVDFLVEYQNK